MASSLAQVITDSEKQNSGYRDFFLALLKQEADLRLKNEIQRRRKAARLPLKNDLENYDKNAENGLTPTRINQLRGIRPTKYIFQ